MTTPPSIAVDEMTSLVPRPELWGAIRVKDAQAGRLELVGWVLAPRAEVEAVELATGGSVVAATAPGLPRADVAAEFPDRPEAANCGFELAVEAQGEGRSDLEIEAVLSDGRRISIGEVSVSATASQSLVARFARRRQKKVDGPLGSSAWRDATSSR